MTRGTKPGTKRGKYGKISYALTRGAIMLQAIHKPQSEILADLGAHSVGSVSHWIHGRWLPSAERRVKMQGLYGIPVEAWDEVVRPARESDLAAMQRQRDEKNRRVAAAKALKEEPVSETPVPVTSTPIVISPVVDGSARYPRTLGALALETIGRDVLLQSLPLDDQLASSLGSSISGWISGRWLPSHGRQQQLAKLYGIPVEAWAQVMIDVSPEEKEALERAAEERREKDRQKESNYASSKGAAMLDSFMRIKLMSVTELGRYLGVDSTASNRWLFGIRIPSSESRKLLLEKCGIPKNAWGQPAPRVPAPSAPAPNAPAPNAPPATARPETEFVQRVFGPPASMQEISLDLILTSLASQIITQDQATAMLQKLQALDAR